MDPEKTEARGVAAPKASGSGPSDTDRGANDSAKPFGVYCFRDDGRRRLFGRYTTRAEAGAVAKTLNNVGCRAEVEAAS